MMTNRHESTPTTSFSEQQSLEPGSQAATDFCDAVLASYDPDAFERLVASAAAKDTIPLPITRLAYIALHWPDAFGGPFSQSLIRKLARERNERLTGDALTTLTGAQRRNRLAALKAFIEAANWIGRDGLSSFEGNYLRVKTELSERGIRWSASDVANNRPTDCETAERAVERTQFYEDFARSVGFADMLRVFKARAEKPNAGPQHPVLAWFIASDRPDAWQLYGFLRRIGLTIHIAAHEHRVTQDEDDEAPDWPGESWIDHAYAALQMIFEDLGDAGLQRIRVCRNPRCGRYFYARHSSQRSCSDRCTNRRKQQILSGRRRKTASS